MNEERPATEDLPRPDGIEVLQREDEGDAPGETGGDADDEELNEAEDDEEDIEGA